MLFVPYILLVLFITFIGFKSLIKFKGEDKFKVGAIFGIWLGTIAVNGVTIDNLGVGVWLWITGGVLIAVSVSSEKKENSVLKEDEKSTKGKVKLPANTESIFPMTYFFSFIASILVLVFLVPALGKSSALYNFRNNAPSYTTQTYLAALVSESKGSSNDPQYLIQLANLAIKQNAANEALVMTNQINKVDPRSYYGNYFGAAVNEALNKRSEAIKYREALLALDPWNTASQIELIRNYLAIGDKASAQEVADLIKQNYPGSQADIDASALLVG
jgi:hypothetical protein